MTILASSSIYSTNTSRFELGAHSRPVSCFRAFFRSTARRLSSVPTADFIRRRAQGRSRPAGALPLPNSPAFSGRAFEGPEHGGNIARLGQVAVPSTKKPNPPLDNFKPVVFDRFHAVGDTMGDARIVEPFHPPREMGEGRAGAKSSASPR